MLNPEVNHFTTAEATTQIASYFEIVDNAVKIGDTNHRYIIDQQASYAPSAPIHAGSSTIFIISPTCENTADLYNGFIKAQMVVDIYNETTYPTYANAPKGDLNLYWFGFKDAFDAVENYEILVNGVSKYQQTFVPEESFITSMYLDNNVRKSNLFTTARHKDIFKMPEENINPTCGTFVKFPENENVTDAPFGLSFGIYTIPLKIPIRRFLPLRNLKYLPEFCGKFELRVTFGTSAMVYCPLQVNIPVTNYFSPIGTAITGFKRVLVDENPVYDYQENQILNVRRDFVVKQAYTVIPNFGIRDEVYRSIKESYKDSEFIIPTQTLLINSMSNPIRFGNGQNASTLTLTPKFIDTFFFLFPQKSNYHTCFVNPNLESVYLKCGGYGTIPNGTYATGHKDDEPFDPLLFNMTNNGLNNAGDLKGLNSELLNSLTYIPGTNTPSRSIISNDITNFLLVMPCETDNTFQQGQVSNSSITYELLSKNINENYYNNNNPPPPIMACLCDSVISVKVGESRDTSSVLIGTYDITTPE